MSLLLDALHRGTGGARRKDYAYLYSAEEASDQDATGFAPSTQAKPSARPTGFKKPVSSVPRWGWLALGGILVLTTAAGAAYVWLAGGFNAGAVNAYSPPPGNIPARVVPAQPAAPAPAIPVIPAASANAAVVSAPPPLPPVQPSMPQASASSQGGSRLSVSLMPSLADDMTGPNLSDGLKPDTGKAPKRPIAKSRGEDRTSSRAPARQTPARPQPSAQVANPGPDELTKSELAFELANAWGLLERGKWADAEADYRVIISRSKSPEPDAVLGLAVALHRQKRWAEAWDAYEASLRVWPSNPVAPTAMLDILAHTNAPTAEARLKQWIIERPNDAAAFSSYGMLLGRRESWPEAQGMFRRALDLEPSNGAYAYNLAVSLDRSSRFAEAAQLYQAALSIGVVPSTATTIKARLADLAQMVGRP